MKKFAFLSLLLAMLLLLQGVAMPAVATTSVDPTATGTETASPVGDITVITGCKTIDGMIPLGGNDRMLETAQAAFIYERNTDTILYSYNPDLRLAPGSLMKILTALIAIEQCSLDEEITVNTNSISRLPVGSMTAKLKNGEVITMRDALHLLLLQSANDAALVIAEHVAGSEAAFVKLMNDRVAQMGCTNTVLINCHGLDNAAQYTTARDMVRIIDEAIRNETFKELFGTVSYTMPPTNRVEKEREVVSGNHLIWERDLPQFNDSRVTGGMPSYTSEQTGASVVFTADHKGMETIMIVMGGERTFRKSGVPDYYGNFEEALDLLEYTYSGFHIKEILYDGQALNQFPVANGECSVVGKPVESFVAVLPVKAQMRDLTFQYNVQGGLNAPIAAGQKIASVQVWYRSSCITEKDLFALNPVRAADNTGVDIQGFGRYNSGGALILRILGMIVVIILVVVGGYLGYNYLRRYLARNRRRRRRASRRRSR